MGEAQVDQNQLEQIGNYVKIHIGQWIKEQNIFPYPQQERSRDTELLERMVTVEQQLKFQNEKLELMMQHSDRRFEELQRTMNQRFNRLYGFLSALFITMLGGFIPLIIKAI